MWSKMPGRINSFLSLAGFLALVLTVLTPGPACCRPKGPAQVETPPPPKAETEIAITGKVFASLKRRVNLPFQGIITTLKVQSGQPVKKGEVLATYRLTPAALLAIRQRLSPVRLTDTEVKLARAERSLVPLKDKRAELTRLTGQKLAPAGSLNQLDREIKRAREEQQALKRLQQQERRSLAQDQALLSEQLGQSLKNGEIPREAVLRAPIDGYVIWINPEMRPEAELPATPGVFQVGVMDPMLIRAQAFEVEALKIHPGTVAEVTLESLPGRRFEARVSRVSWASLNANLDQPSYYEVELQVPNPDLALKEGLKASLVFKKSP
jgi:multidrug efflux pump subunit AcrA (membrane-fusion protein)